MWLGKSFEKVLERTIAIVAIAMVMYQLVSTQVLLFGPTLYLHGHLSFSLVLVFLILIRQEKKANFVWIAALIASLVAIAYVYILVDELEQRALFNTTADLIIGVILIILALVACWKSFGPVLTVFASICILYFALSHYLPAFLRGPQYPMYRLIPSLSIGLSSGMYGLVLSVSANMVFLFMVFGGLLRASGATRFFIELGKVVGHKLAGGPALTAILGSALVGMCTGAAAANIAITGAFTIPAMKKVGYSPNQAGAIEATASTGGQIMPPVMGAAAFGLSAFTGVPYLKVIAAAALPAAIYFVSLGLGVRCWAVKYQLGKTTFAEKIDSSMLLATAPCFILPLVTLIVVLMLGRSPQYAACWTIATLLIVSFFRKETRFTLAKLREGLISGAYSGAQICAASATIGFILTTFNETGLAFKLPIFIEDVASGNLFVCVLLVFLVSLIVGCGMPTMAVYFTVATLSAPLLIRMGMPLLSAHLFVLYAGVYSYLTPPVAIGSLVASRLAGGSFIGTSVAGLRLLGVAYILPFLVVLSPALTLQETGLLEWVKVAASFLMIVYFSILIERYWLGPLSLGQWLLSFLIAGLGFTFLLTSAYWAFATSIGLFILLILWELRERPKVGGGYA